MICISWDCWQTQNLTSSSRKAEANISANQELIKKELPGKVWNVKEPAEAVLDGDVQEKTKQRVCDEGQVISCSRRVLLALAPRKHKRLGKPRKLSGEWPVLPVWGEFYVRATMVSHLTDGRRMIHMYARKLPNSSCLSLPRGHSNLVACQLSLRLRWSPSVHKPQSQ